MSKRFVKIDECNRDEELGFMDTILGIRYHLTKEEYNSLVDIIFKHESKGWEHLYPEPIKNATLECGHKAKLINEMIKTILNEAEIVELAEMKAKENQRFYPVDAEKVGNAILERGRMVICDEEYDLDDGQY